MLRGVRAEWAIPVQNLIYCIIKQVDISSDDSYRDAALMAGRADKGPLYIF